MMQRMIATLVTLGFMVLLGVVIYYFSASEVCHYEAVKMPVGYSMHLRISTVCCVLDCCLGRAGASASGASAYEVLWDA